MTARAWELEYYPTQDAANDATPVLAGSKAGSPAPLDWAHDLISGLPEQIAVVDACWTILTVYDSWTAAIEHYGYPQLRVGGSYRQFCLDRAAEGHEGGALSMMVGDESGTASSS